MRTGLRHKPKLGKSEPTRGASDVPVLHLRFDDEGLVHAMSSSISYDGARCWHPSTKMTKHSVHNIAKGPITCLACAARTY